MTPHTNAIRLRRAGYRIWRIAELTGMSETDVLEILVDAGMIPLGTCEAVVGSERSIVDIETVRETRRKYNLKRRKGGGNWIGR